MRRASCVLIPQSDPSLSYPAALAAACTAPSESEASAALPARRGMRSSTSLRHRPRARGGSSCAQPPCQPPRRAGRWPCPSRRRPSSLPREAPRDAPRKASPPREVPRPCGRLSSAQWRRPSRLHYGEGRCCMRHGGGHAGRPPRDWARCEPPHAPSAWGAAWGAAGTGAWAVAPLPACVSARFGSRGRRRLRRLTAWPRSEPAHLGRPTAHGAPRSPCGAHPLRSRLSRARRPRSTSASATRPWGCWSTWRLAACVPRAHALHPAARSPHSPAGSEWWALLWGGRDCVAITGSGRSAKSSTAGSEDMEKDHQACAMQSATPSSHVCTVSAIRAGCP